MRQVAATLRSGSRRVARLARSAAGSAPVSALARAGFVTKAALYALVGALALRGALGMHGGRTLDVKAALAMFASQPLGPWIAGAAAAGLAGLGAFFVLEGLATRPGDPSEPFGVVSRVGQAAGGVGYIALASVAAGLALGDPAGPSGDQLARALASRVLAQPTGPWAAAVVGLGAIGVGARQVWFGVTRRFLRALDLESAPRPLVRAASVLGAFGFLAQGTLFALVGVFVIQAVLERDPGEATGTGGALAALAARPHAGPALLLAASAGLLAYALYAGVEGATRKFPA